MLFRSQGAARVSLRAFSQLQPQLSICGPLLHRAFSTGGFRKPLIVQKYGGTSLGTTDKLEKVLKCVEKYHGPNRVFAVVSAFSSHVKEEGTTSLLLAAADAATNPKSAASGDYAKFIHKIADTHLSIIYTALNGQIRDEARESVTAELADLTKFLDSLSFIKEVSPRSHNKIIGTGERLAATVVSGWLRQNDIPSVAVDLSYLEDSIDTSNTEGVDFSISLKEEIAKYTLARLVDMPDETVPIITGYFGDVKGGLVEKVGRGYSDLTAALTAAGCGAQTLQVWKESDGIFTGNPTKIPKARLIQHVAPEEAAELTAFGNEVLHPFTMACALRDNVGIHILNTFDLSSNGTIVGERNELDSLADPSMRTDAGQIVAVTSKDVTMVELACTIPHANAMEYLYQVCKCFHRHHVAADMVAMSTTSIAMTIPHDLDEKTKDSLKKELRKTGTVHFEPDRAIVCVIGRKMNEQLGTASRMFSCLTNEGVNIEIISQGPTELQMACVVAERDKSRAVAAVHKEFLEEDFD